MATPTPAAQAAQAAHLPTRQQLDEIDALLRRMLTLPPLAGEAFRATPTEAPAPAEPPPAVSYPTPVIREVAPPRPPAAGDPIVQEWRVGWPQPAPAQPQSLVAWGSPVPLATAAEAPYEVEPPPAPHYPPSLQYAPATAPSAASGSVLSFAVEEPTPAGSGSREVSPALWPLIVLNVVFNVLTYLLGPLGTWLRGPGRTVMGGLGIVMVLAAGVWAAGEWYGYEWPKVDTSAIQSRLGLDR